jgi:hypothetical protein
LGEERKFFTHTCERKSRGNGNENVAGSNDLTHNKRKSPKNNQKVKKEKKDEVKLN